MGRRLFSVLSGALLLSGCQSTAPITSTLSQHPVTPAEVDAVVYGIQTNFRDPNSAQIMKTSRTGLIEAYGQQYKVVCILANAKNSMGGYTGLHVTAIYMTMDSKFRSMGTTEYSTTVCPLLF
ncbi:hypothetical protein [Aquamicrobium soli]|uniref:Lipoprotein n=1 Tax=Aquamicrobium soli TaxID=1811518 RepID=A0ABV7KDH8_9HYPH